MKRITLVSFIFALTASFSFADLESQLQSIFNKNTPAVEWSVLVEEKNSGDEVFSLTPKRQLVPASNMKVIIGAAALLELGPDYQYPTTLYHTGKIDGGILQGNLIVVGSGDPSIGGRFNNGNITALFERWASMLKDQNIKKINGDILGVDNVFDDMPRGLNWNPIDFVKWYAAEVSALNLNDGCVDITVVAGSKPGAAPRISMDPDTNYVNLVKTVRTVSHNHRHAGVVVEREPTSNTIHVKGTIPIKRSRRIYASIHNPTHYFVTVLQETLASEGILVSGTAKDADDPNSLPPQNEWQLLDIHKSLPFAELLAACLKRSQNLYAEQFLKTIGAQRYDIGSYETGVLALKNILFEHGCNLDRAYIGDGSGLSRENRLSADTLVRVLRVMSRSKYAEVFKDCLAEAGVDGTLKRRMRDPSTRQQVFAKTGTLKGVNALSGYIEADSGKEYIFAMIANSPNIYYRFTGMIDDACEQIAEHG